MSSHSQPNGAPAIAPIGLSDPQYAARRKRMFEFLTRVRALGADVTLDIPAIAVIGWQSAGKSSLIEAISGITLPRASGTCTRCPTECQLTHSDNTPWTCKVSLQMNTAADGSALATLQKIPFGEPITEKVAVTERIRRAQRAILNPSTPPNVFLQGANTEHEISFSANRIVLDISGPDVTDLNFIDLPGLFVGGGEDAEMRLIRNLAITYMKKPSCIILLTVSCETDFVNQGAHLLAKEYDPHGDRTIGVLTKPDRIPPTEEENWLPFIREERDDTTLWFCVKCPNTQAIDDGITWEGARRAESEFFSEKVPWSTLQREFKSKLGTGHLTRHLSDKLCNLISDRLPHIERELNKLLEKTNKELEDLPLPPSSAPLREIFRLITEFTRAVERQGEGIPGREGLLQQIRSPQEKFRVTIRKTAPCFVPQFRKKPIREEPLRVGPSRYEELYDDVVGPPSPPPAPALRVASAPRAASPPYVLALRAASPPYALGPQAASPASPPAPRAVSALRAAPAPQAASPSSVHVLRATAAPRAAPAPSSPSVPVLRAASPPSRPVAVDAQPAPAVSEVGTRIRPPFLVGEEHYDDIGFNDVKSIFIDDVLETAEWAVTRELPNNYPFIVQKEYILAFVKQWDDPARTLSVATVRKLKELTLRIVETHFGQYTHSHLKQRVSNIVVTRLDQCYAETSKRVKFLLEVEREPSTKHTHYFKDYRRKFLCFYTGLYHQDSNDYFIERVQGRMYRSSGFIDALEIIMSNLPKIGLRNVKPLELAILQTSEDADDALRIMADVRAYFQVAFKRFVDNVIKAIDEELVLGLAKGLQDVLVSGLKLDSPDAHETCARLVAEAPHIAGRRKSLLATRETLLLVREELYNALS